MRLFFFFSSFLGAIFVIESLDYESSHEYYLTVEATDGGTPSLSDVVTVNINVTDINDNSPVFSQDTYTAVVSEDAMLEQSVITVRIGFFTLKYSVMMIMLSVLKVNINE